MSRRKADAPEGQADQRAAREQVEQDLDLMLSALHPGVQALEPAEVY